MQLYVILFRELKKFHLELIFVLKIEVMVLASKTWWKIQLCVRDPVSSTVLPTSAKDELFWKFMVLLEAWSVCSSYLSLSFSQNEQAFEEVFQNANFNTYEFRIRVKLETYNVSIPQKANHVAGGFCGLTCPHRRWLPSLAFVGRNFQKYLLTQMLSVLSIEGGIHCCWHGFLSGSSSLTICKWKQCSCSGSQLCNPS